MRWRTVIVPSAGEHVDGGREQLEVARSALGEQQADREDHDAHRAAGDADLALDAQRLGAGAGVADHQRGQDGDDARRRRRTACRASAKYGGDRGQDDALLDAVQRRVQERAERRALARHARVAAVERVADRADDERDAAEEE